MITREYIVTGGFTSELLADTLAVRNFSEYLCEKVKTKLHYEGQRVYKVEYKEVRNGYFVFNVTIPENGEEVMPNEVRND